MKTRVQTASNQAVAYLEREKETIKSDTYLLCLATYALTMANSAIKDELRMALDAKAKGEGMIKRCIMMRDRPICMSGGGNGGIGDVATFQTPYVDHPGRGGTGFAR